MAYSNQDYIDIFTDLTYSREFSLVVEEYFLKGKLPGGHHPSIGEEALNVGIFTELQENDWIVPEHRSRPMIGKKAGLVRWLCEIMGRQGGFNGGLAGDPHFYDPENHLGPYSGLLGQAQALAVGRAMQYKMDNVDGAVVIGCGDGTLNEGVCGELLNMIAAWKLPVVWYVQNNGWSVASKSTEVTGLTDLSQRAQGYGIASGTYDGSDVLTVKEVVREALAKARRGEPSLLEFQTKRWSGHYIGDPQETYRDMAEVEYAKANKDPVKKMRDFCIIHKAATAEQLDAITAEQNRICRDAIEEAMKSPLPEVSHVRDPKLVYAPF